eukprot:6203787-Pleurochrysis_carterae.AAC.1
MRHATVHSGSSVINDACAPASERARSNAKAIPVPAAQPASVPHSRSLILSHALPSIRSEQSTKVIAMATVSEKALTLSMPSVVPSLPSRHT